MTTIAKAIAEATSNLESANVDDPRREARLLIGAALQKTSTQIFNSVDEIISQSNLDRISELLSRRANGEPVAYILGEREFWSLPLMVSPATLIPRPDSETLIELVLEHYSDCPPGRILDLGTGSGCLLLALLSEFKMATGVGVDISADAIAVAAENAKRVELFDRSDFLQGNWTKGQVNTFDLIVSNPPYIPTRDIDGLDKDVRAFEPMTALDGGDDGLDMYRAIFSAISQVLAADGKVVVENGIGQRDDVCRIALIHGFDLVQARADIGGIIRGLMFHKKGVGITGGKR
ncbi:peptide chain release factor N(5)-glutamine methyltransferase [Rhodospirillales bacterium]|nr:peptide chain release factor N(5)-glutamine methyltransferase [Rhodospirillales bacterium]